MKNIKIMVSLLMATALLVACGSKTDLTVCETDLGFMKLSVEVSSKEDTIVGMVQTITMPTEMYGDKTVDEIEKELLSNLETTTGVTTKVKESDDGISATLEIKDLTNATDEQKQLFGLKDMSLEKYISEAEAASVTCTKK